MKSGTEKQISYGITYMWNLKYDTNELIYETETGSQTQKTDRRLPGERGFRGGKDCEAGVSRCKLLYRVWINNKVLLDSTENYIQYTVINRNGKEHERMYIYKHTHICISASLCCKQKLTL